MWYMNLEAKSGSSQIYQFHFSLLQKRTASHNLNLVTYNAPTQFAVWALSSWAIAEHEVDGWMRLAGLASSTEAISDCKYIAQTK